LSFIANLASRQAARSPPTDQGSILLPGEFHLTFGGLPRSLLKGVQHINGLRELGDIQDPVLQRGMDPDLSDARPHAGHGFQVDRVQSLLDTSELKASESPDVPRESPNVAPRSAQPLEHLVGHG